MKSTLLTCGAAAALTFTLALVPAHAADALTETFENTTPDQYNQGVYGGTIAHTGLEVTTAYALVRHDPSGAPEHGSFLELPTGWYSNNYANGVGTSAVQSIATFDLLAGNQYALSFDWSRRQGASGNGPFDTSLTASLGSQSVSYADVTGFYYLYDWKTVTLSWTQGATELGAHVSFLGSGDGYSGVVIDNISLIGTAAVPEPETYALMLAGLAAVGWAARRRTATT